MSEFSYQGVDKAGKKVAGKLEGASEGELRMKLRDIGIRPTRIAKADGGLSKALPGGKKMNTASVPLPILLAFTRQLQVLIGAGIPLVQGLELLVEQSTNATMKSVALEVKDKVSSGTYLWQALGAYPKVFPKLYVALIRAGEASGSMDQMLKRLGRYLEDADRLQKMVKGAMMYPAIVISIGVGVVSLMMVFVIPKFEALLKSNGQELPLPTQMVINLSHFMINNILFILVGAAVFGYLLKNYLKSDEGKAVIDRTMYRAPLFGNLMQKSGIARFARTMQTLLASGVNLIDAIDICRSTIDNAVLEVAMSRIRSDVESGKTLGQVVGKLDVFPKSLWV